MPLNSICVARTANGFPASKLCSEKIPPANLPAGFADRDRMRTNPDFLDGIARQLMSRVSRPTHLPARRRQIDTPGTKEPRRLLSLLAAGNQNYLASGREQI